MSETPSAYQPRCKFLCCKSMMVYGEDFRDDPEYQAGTNDFWCVHTSKGAGPDGEFVSLEMCSNSERGCFQEF